MERNDSKVRLFTYIFSAVLLAFSANVNFDIARHYFAQDTVIYNYSDFVFTDRVWSAIIATILLIFTYHMFTARKVVIFLSVVYIFSQVNMIVSMNENMIRLHYFLLTTTGFALFAFLFSLMLVETKIREDMNLAIFFSMLVIGFLCSEVANYFLLPIINSSTLNRMMGFNILPTAILIFVFSLNSSFKIGKRRPLPDFVMTFRFSELEAIVNLGIFFVIMSLYEERNLLEDKLSLVHFSDDEIWYYFCGAILALIYPVTHYTKKVPVHKLNMVCLGILLLCFLSMQLWVGYIILGFSIWIVIALCMYLLFVGNIMILFAKFKPNEMFGVLMIFFYVGAMGLYVGHIAATNVELEYATSTSAGNLSNLSISIVIGTIFVYYLFRFIKDRLYINE